jgi:drug/metabolite transporter (DMT)-like permease
MGRAMTHRQAVLGMVAVTLMWSIAGVVTRQLDSARSFEVTFWRSLFNALSLGAMLAWLQGPRQMWRSVVQGGRVLWISGLCWSVMYTAFMVAIMLTTVANVLVTMALSPMFTALMVRITLKQRLPLRTWVAVVVAGLGIGWMYGSQLAAPSGAGQSTVLGTLVALCVPLSAAVNWTAIQRVGRQGAAAPDLMPAVLIGAVLSVLFTLPLSLPFAASGSDLRWLALLGAVQLALPCLLVVRVARVLSAPEVALLGLREVIFGVLWAWLGAHEAPTPAVLGGGGLVLGALVANEVLGLRRSSLRSRVASEASRSSKASRA